MSKQGKSKGHIRGLFQRAGGVWYSRIAGVDGQIIRKRLSSDKQTAITILGEMRKVIDLQRSGLLPANYVKKVTELKELTERYLTHLKAGTCAVSSIEAFLLGYRAVTNENKFVHLSDITLEAIDKWSMLRLSKGTRGQTVNGYIGHIRRFLEWARKKEYIHENPLANWQPVRLNEPRKRRDLQPHEVTAILNAEKSEGWKLLWLVYFFTGLRREAGVALLWEWIDWENRLIRVPVENNKSRKSLSLPIHPLLFDALASRMAEHGREPAGRVFKRVSGSKIYSRFKRLCKAAGIDAEGVSLHSIRHTVATMLYESTGRNLKAVQEILGHSNAAITMRYLHMTDQDKLNVIGTLDYGLERRPAVNRDDERIIKFPAAEIKPEGGSDDAQEVQA